MQWRSPGVGLQLSGCSVSLLPEDVLRDAHSCLFEWDLLSPALLQHSHSVICKTRDQLQQSRMARKENFKWKEVFAVIKRRCSSSDAFSKLVVSYFAGPTKQEEEKVKTVRIANPIGSTITSVGDLDQSRLLLPEFEDLRSSDMGLPCTDDVSVIGQSPTMNAANFTSMESDFEGTGNSMVVHEGNSSKSLEEFVIRGSRGLDRVFGTQDKLCDGFSEISELSCSYNRQNDTPTSFPGYNTSSRGPPSAGSECNFSDFVGEDAVELRNLRHEVNELRERELKLESELLEYYGLQEQENAATDLKNALKDKNGEIGRLNCRILSFENQKMKEIVAADNLKKDLEEARARIKELQKQIQSEARQDKSRILTLKQQVAALEIKEQHATKRDFEMEKNLKELEVQVVELRRTNKELQHQKRELNVQLAAAEAQMATFSSISENELIFRAEAEAKALRHTNEDLYRQVEGLQNNRFSEVEELVYLRWVNACLRYELRNSESVARGKALQLNKTLSPKSQEKAKQLMLEYAGPDLLALRTREQFQSGYESASSQPSTSSECGESDDSSVANSGGRHSSGKKSSLMKRLKRWGKNKDDLHLIVDSCQLPEGLQSGRGNPRQTNLESVMLRHCNNAVEITSYGAKNYNPTDSSSSSCTSFSRLNAGALPAKSLPVKPTFEKTNNLNSIAASFQIMSRSVARSELADKYPAFKDRHRLAIQRERSIKAKAEEVAANKRPEAVCKMSPAEVEKRALRKAKPPPKPSSAPVNGNAIPVQVRGSIPAPPPPPRLGCPGAPPPPSGVVGAPPPPPPPPLATFGKSKVPAENKVQRVPEVVEFYQSLMKRDVKKDATNGPTAGTNIADARNNMIGEIENRSSHLLAIKADVGTQGEFVQSIATEVRAAVYTNIDDVVAFVNWLDEELSFLVDERAVLKHFDWPEAKADALREAAFEYQDLKRLQHEIASYQDDSRMGRDAALQKMQALLEKIEQSIYAVLRTRDMTISRHKEFNIPTYWMLDSGLIGKIKHASVNLAQQYMKRVVLELDSLKGSPEKEPVREFFLLQGVRFAFRVHQFAGGFDPESMRAFEELRNRARNAKSC